LIDGQRVGSSFNGLSALQHIPLTQIDRIEIVRGPAASLYGADAVSGVIQVFTQRAGGLSASAAVGNQRSSDVSARAGFTNGGHAFSIAANQREARGFNAIVDPDNFSFNPDRDGYRFSSAQANGVFAVTPAFTIEANALAARGNTQYDGSAEFDDRIKSTFHNVGAKAVYTVSDRWNASLALGQGLDRSEFVSSFPGTYKTTQDQASWQNNFKLDRSTSLWSALEWRRERIASTEAFLVDSRRTTSAAIGGDTALGNLKLAGSLRVDNSDQFDTNTTGNVGLAYALSRDWRVSANAGTSFKAPTFNDLYFPGFANPNLSPEKGRNVEVAIAWSRGLSNAKLVVYENRVRDLIQFQCDANFNCTPQNVAKANLFGATISGSTKVAGWTIDGNVDIGDPKDANTDKRLPRRTKVHGALKLSGEVFGVSSGVEVIASGDRFDNASNTRRLAGYGVVNVFARKQVWPGVTVGARIENALDRGYEFSRGYATGGRRMWITVSVKQL
jgi:vitamin B12 transporter